MACTLHQGQSSLVQSSPRPDSLGNFSWIQFHLWPLSRQLEPWLHKRPSFTLNVRTSSSPDPYYHMNGPENGTGSKERQRSEWVQAKWLIFRALGLPFLLTFSLYERHICTDVTQESSGEYSIAFQSLEALKSNLRPCREVSLTFRLSNLSILGYKLITSIVLDPVKGIYRKNYNSSIQGSAPLCLL